MLTHRPILMGFIILVSSSLNAAPDYTRLINKIDSNDGCYSIALDDNVGSCLAPTGFYTSILSSDYATIGWNDVNPGGTYTLQYGLTGFDYLDPDEGIYSDSESTTKTITGLSYETTYDVYVRSECVNPTTSSDWAGPYSFTTYAEPFCEAPFDLILQDVGLDYATLSWTYPSSANGGKVQYGPVGHDPTQISQGNWVSVFGPSVYTFEGLDPGTSYDFYVQSNCVNPFADSEWAGPYTFQTEGYAGCDAPTAVMIQEVNFGTVNARVKPLWTNPEGTNYCEVRGGRISPSSLNTPQPVFANIFNLRTLTGTNGSALNFNIRLYTDAGYNFIVGEAYGAEVRCACEGGEGMSGWSLLTTESIFTVPDPFEGGQLLDANTADSK